MDVYSSILGSVNAKSNIVKVHSRHIIRFWHISCKVSFFRVASTLTYPPSDSHLFIEK